MWVVVATAGGDNHIDEMFLFGPFDDESKARFWARTQNRAAPNSWHYEAKEVERPAPQSKICYCLQEPIKEIVL